MAGNAQGNDTQNPTPQNVGVRKKRWVVCFENTILDLDLSVYEKMVYIVLCSHAKKDGSCYPSVKKIAEEASCSRAKVFEALKILEKQGIIARASQIYEGRGQTSNLYEIIDIQPRPQGGPGGDRGSLSPSTIETGGSTAETDASATQTGESATWMGGVHEMDAHIMVLEQDHINRTKEHPPLSPRRGVEGGGESFDSTSGNLKTKEHDTEGNGLKTGIPVSGTQKEAEFRSCRAILEAYNAILPELPKAENVTTNREKVLEQRIRDDPDRRDLEWWKSYFRRVREFPWPMGDNPNDWRADFDWLIGESGMQKIIEGSFRRSSGSGKRGRTEAGAELQKKYTNERGIVDAGALLWDQ